MPRDVARDRQRAVGRHAAAVQMRLDRLAEPLRAVARDDPQGAATNTGEVRQARFSAWLLMRSRGTPPTVAVFGRPVSSRLRLDGG